MSTAMRKQCDYNVYDFSKGELLPHAAAKTLVGSLMRCSGMRTPFTREVADSGDVLTSPLRQIWWLEWFWSCFGCG